MNTSNEWQNFCALYYEQAVSTAKKQLYKLKGQLPHWNNRIAEEDIIVDAAMDSLQQAFTKFDPTRGFPMSHYLFRIIQHEVQDKVEKELRKFSKIEEIDNKKENDYTLSNMVSAIPQQALENLIDKLRSAILLLSPIDQTILSFFIKDPRTFVEKSAEALGVKPGYVSVRKNRALAQLPALMGMTPKDYYEMFEGNQYAGIKEAATVKNFHMSFITLSEPKQPRNPIYPQFDLEGTVQMFASAIEEILGRN